MSPFSNQSDLPTDTYSMTPASSSAPKTGANANPKKVSAIAAATLMLGGAAWAVIDKSKSFAGAQESPIDEAQETVETIGVQIPEDINVADKVTDNMSYEQAFATAREEVGMGGVFSWHGNWHNTFEKEEWAGLPLEQRQQYTEDIAGEKLPVKPYVSTQTDATVTSASTPENQLPAEPEPTIIEGYLNGQRVMGLDYDQDGVIDTLVLDAKDGHTYRVVDANGDQGLDTLYRFDSLNGELVEIEKLEEPFVLSNDQFNEELEASMSEDVMVYILETDIEEPAETSVAETPTTETPVLETATPETTETPDVQSFRDHEMEEYRANENEYLTDSNERDDTYINNGDVRDMHE